MYVYDSIYIYMYVCMCVCVCMYVYIYFCVGERFKKGQISNLLGFRYLVPLGFRFHYFGFQICRGRQARCMAVANEFPCSWQRYRGWSPWRTCTSFHFVSNFWPGQGLNPRTSLQVIFFWGTVLAIWFSSTSFVWTTTCFQVPSFLSSVLEVFLHLGCVPS